MIHSIQSPESEAPVVVVPVAPSADDCLEALIHVLPRLTRVIKSQMRGGKLSAQHTYLLMSVHEMEQINPDGAQPGELARRACLSSAAITAALDDLVNDGYCARAHSEKDRRKVLVRLTPHGEHTLDELRAGTREALGGMLDDWTDEQRTRLCQALADLDAAAIKLLRRTHGGVEGAS
jgi:DNA-binding MarR family transcriptional regulator